MTDAFDGLTEQNWTESQDPPRPEFVRTLKAQLQQLIETSDINIRRASGAAAPGQNLTSQTGTSTSSTTSSTTTTGETMSKPSDLQNESGATAVTPYLTVSDGAAALDFYASAFGAVEVMRMAMGDDARIGHAEFRIGAVTFFLSEEFPEMGVKGPITLGGTAVALHLTVADVDSVFARAVAAGATELQAVADQPHGHRQGTLSDPFGHRWMLSSQIEQLTTSEIAERLRGGGEVTLGPGADTAPGSGIPGTGGGIWAALNYADAEAGIAFCCDVLGFERQIVVPGDEPGVVVHSQLVWPEGGIVQAGTANREDNEFSMRPTGTENLYVITADPMAVHARCVAAGVEMVREPEVADYDSAGGVNFTIRDPEGNLWTFGSYAGEG